MVTERRRHVVMNGEMMRNVDVEARCQHLQPAQTRRREIQRLTGRLVDKRFVNSNRFITHRHSTAERGGCFQRRLFVCQSNNFRTIKRRMTKLGGGALYKSHSSSNLGL